MHQLIWKCVTYWNVLFRFSRAWWENGKKTTPSSVKPPSALAARRCTERGACKRSRGEKEWCPLHLWHLSHKWLQIWKHSHLVKQKSFICVFFHVPAGFDSAFTLVMFLFSSFPWWISTWYICISTPQWSASTFQVILHQHRYLRVSWEQSRIAGGDGSSQRCWIIEEYYSWAPLGEHMRERKSSLQRCCIFLCFDSFENSGWRCTRHRITALCKEIKVKSSIPTHLLFRLMGLSL